MGKQRWMAVVWTAFLAAGVVEMLVFAAFDPQDMLWPAGAAQLSRTALYSLSFLLFWGVLVVAGYITLLLSLPARAINARMAHTPRH